LKFRRRAALTCLVAASSALVFVPSASSDPVPRVTVFILHDASAEELLSIPVVSRLAMDGGSALLANADDLVADVRGLQQDPPPGVAGATEVSLVDLGTPPEGAARSAFLARAGQQLDAALSGPDGAGLVVVATVGFSPGMVSRGDQLSAIVVADPSLGLPLSAWPTVGTTLSSSSTRRPGVVTGADLVPTIALFLGAPGANATGVMETTGFAGESSLPIHERYLSVRRMYVPVAIVAAGAVFLLLIFALSAFYRRTDLPRWALFVGQWACLATPALAVSLLAAGHLPTLSYPWVALVATAATVLVPVAALAWRGSGVLTPPLALGMMILGFFAIEAATGWYGTMFTMMGGTALDGARFYGLPNAFEGLLIGSAVYIAASLGPLRGFAVIIAVAIFVGVPGLGADLGGALAALAAAGLWLMLRTRDRFGWKEAGVTLATVIIGTGVILLAHRFLAPSPTHGTVFVGTSSRDPLHVLSTLWERLGIGIRLLRRNPIGLVYLAATPVLIWVVARQRAGLRDSFAALPHWRHAILTILWASVVGYFVNDTGVSAVGMGFAMALGGLLYVPLAREVVKMDER